MESQKERLRINSNYILRQVAEENILVHVGESNSIDSRLIMLNETGCFIWKMLEYPLSLTELIQKARTEFSGEDDQIDNEVREFIRELLKAGLLIKEESQR